MKPTPIEPRDESRIFAADEIFFSTTDARGVITSGNEVFVRISGYEAEDLIGKAHNVIRHPDMPRAAFRLVWSFLQQARPVAALVKNLAKDGCHYWVIALIVPAGDGYLSVRFKPTGPLFPKVGAIYGRMLAEERRVRSAGGGEDAAMDAATRLLTEALQDLGFEDYAAFMRALLSEEMKSRDAVLAREGRAVVRPLPETVREGGGTDATSALLEGVARDGFRAYHDLDRLYRRLDDFIKLQQTLENKSSFVDNLTRELRLASMNVALASSRLGGEGQGLGVISHYMGAVSVEVSQAVGTLSTGIHGVAQRLRAVAFNLAAARLQIEMMLVFVHELIQTPPAEAARRGRLQRVHLLYAAFATALRNVSAALGELGHGTRGLNVTSTDLGRHMLGLQVAQLGGVVESTRVADRAKFTDVFTDIRGQIDHTRGELSGLADALIHLDRLADEAPAIAGELNGVVRRMEANITLVQAA